ALEQFLRRDIIAAIEFDDAAVIERVGVARQRRLCAQARLSDGQIDARPCRHFGGVRVLLNQSAKQLPRLTETTARKIFVGPLERANRGHLVLRRLGSGRWSRRSLWARRWCSMFRCASFCGRRMARRFCGGPFSRFGRGSTV